jgi:hypothetical protein
MWLRMTLLMRVQYEDFSRIHSIKIYLEPAVYCPMSTGLAFTGKMRPGRRASSPCSYIKNAWSYTITPHTSAWHGDSFADILEISQLIINSAHLETVTCLHNLGSKPSHYRCFVQ